MAIKKSEIAIGVRVVLNDKWEQKCLGDKYLQDEKVLYISSERPYNDVKGDYVHIGGGSHTNSGYANLDQLDLEHDWRTIIPQKEAYKEGSLMHKGAQDQ